MPPITPTTKTALSQLSLTNPHSLVKPRSVPLADLEGMLDRTANRGAGATSRAGRPDVVWRLYAQNQKAREKIDVLRSERDALAQAQERRECPFRPDIRRSQSTGLGSRVYENDFLARQEKWNEKVRMKHRILQEIQDLRQTAELVFQPAINSRSQIISETIRGRDEFAAQGASHAPYSYVISGSHAYPGASEYGSAAQPRCASGHATMTIEELGQLVTQDECFGYPEITDMAARIHNTDAAYERLYRLAQKGRSAQQESASQPQSGGSGDATRPRRRAGPRDPNAPSVFEKLYNCRKDRPEALAGSVSGTPPRNAAHGSSAGSAGSADSADATGAAAPLHHSPEYIRRRDEMAMRAAKRLREGKKAAPAEEGTRFTPTINRRSAQMVACSFGGAAGGPDDALKRMETLVIRSKNKLTNKRREAALKDDENLTFAPDTRRSQRSAQVVGISESKLLQGDVHQREEQWLERRAMDKQRLREEAARERERQREAQEAEARRVLSGNLTDKQLRLVQQERHNPLRTVSIFPRTRGEVLSLAAKVEQATAGKGGEDFLLMDTDVPCDAVSRDPNLQIFSEILGDGGNARRADERSAMAAHAKEQRPAHEDAAPSPAEDEKKVKLLRQIGNGSILNACTVIDSVSAYVGRMRRAQALREHQRLAYGTDEERLLSN